VFVVAVVALHGPVEAEAPHLAAALGVTAYDAGLLLRAPSPAVVLRTPDRPRALALLGAMRERGHDTVACDATAVVPSSAMHLVRAPWFANDAVCDGSERVSFDAVTALVRASHTSRVETTEKTTETKVSLGRIAMTGGILATKNVKRETTHVSQMREQVLYVFSSSPVPWFVVASRCRYDGLGTPLRPSLHENFEAFVGMMRTRCASAPFDDRLLAMKNADAATADLLANIVALAVTRRR
jgi:hypothetical protein